MLRIVMLGGPGAGKGTISKMLRDHYDIPQISTGDLLRETIKEETELGRRAKSYMDQGTLVPDDIVLELLKERLSQPDAENGFILDGYPRNISQAKALERITQLDFIFNLQASEATIIQRLSGRRTCRKCGAIFHVTNIPPKQEGICDKCGGELFQRDDDKPATIRERLKTYENQTKPLLDFWQDKIINISAEGSPEGYFKKIVEFIEG
jgi:adenylate kinase